MEKDYLKEYHKKDYLKNKDKINARNKIWKEKNKEKQKGYFQKWKNNNREKLRGQKKKIYYLHKLIVDKIIKDFYHGKSISSYPLEAKKMFSRRIVQRIKIPSEQLCGRCKLHLAKEKHHKDYNKPLEVEFLCLDCHVKSRND